MTEASLRKLFLGIVGTSLLGAACSSSSEEDVGSQGGSSKGGGGGAGAATASGGSGAATAGGAGGAPSGTGGAPSGGSGGLASTGGTTTTAGTGGATGGSGGMTGGAGGTTGGAGGTTGGAGGATGGTGGAAPILEGLSMPACTSGFPDLAPGLNLAQPADYAAVVSAGQSFVVDAGAGATVLSDTGTPCDTATDEAACQLALDAAVPSSGLEHWSKCEQIGCTYYGIATTRGDDVELAESMTELLATLGTIDTTSEAIAVALAAGYDVPCGDDGSHGARAVGDGFEVRAQKMVSDCAPILTMGYVLHVATDGTVTIADSWEISRSSACIGRRPEGLVAEAPRKDPSAMGRYFAETAYLEAASVSAFRRLADELRSFGAPEALVRGALDSAEDEIRHARAMGSVAQRFGAAPSCVEVEDAPSRTLEDVALENAVEGCIRETFGALVATYQAEVAEDPEIAGAMRTIAEDETRHAALSWKIHAWMKERLDARAWERLTAAQRQAVETLAEDMSLPVAEELARGAGIPPARLCAEWIAELDQKLWS